MTNDVVSKFIEKYNQKSPKQLFSPAKRIGKLLAEELKNDKHFYFFSPDETPSNKFEEVFNNSKRAWNLKRAAWDMPAAEDGHIIEMLSENVLFSTMIGHLANYEQGMMGSYEAFYSVCASQILQQIKFIKQLNDVSWQKPLPAVNLLSTSTCWRQDHNGFTHQSPAILSTLLSNPSNLVNCFFPVDDIDAETIFQTMLKSTNVVNFTTFNKIELPRYSTKSDTEAQFKNCGVRIFDDFSDEKPEMIFVAVGDIMTKESIEAIKIIKTDLPNLKVRLVNINALSYNAIGTIENKLSPESFDKIFTKDKPLVISFHGYPETFNSILSHYTNLNRVKTHGFLEEGTTTTPFEMLAMNHNSRYHLAAAATDFLGEKSLSHSYQQFIDNNHEYALKFGEDLIL